MRFYLLRFARSTNVVPRNSENRRRQLPYTSCVPPPAEYTWRFFLRPCPPIFLLKKTSDGFALTLGIGGGLGIPLSFLYQNLVLDSSFFFLVFVLVVDTAYRSRPSFKLPSSQEACISATLIESTSRHSWSLIKT